MFWFQRKHEGLHSIFAGSYVEECDLPSKGCGESNSEDWSRTPIQRTKVSVWLKYLIFQFLFWSNLIIILSSAVWSNVIIILSRAVGGVRKRQSGSSNTAADCNFSKGIKVFVLFLFLKELRCNKMWSFTLLFVITTIVQNRSGWDVPLGQPWQLNWSSLGGFYWPGRKYLGDQVTCM